MTKVEFAKALIKVCGQLDDGSFLFGGAVRDLIAADFDETRWNFNDLDIYLNANNSSLFRFSKAVHSTLLYLHSDLLKGITTHLGYGNLERIKIQMTDLNATDAFEIDFVSGSTKGNGPFYRDVDVNGLAINCFTFDSPFYAGKNKLDNRFSSLDIKEVINNIKNREFVANSAKIDRIKKINDKGYSEKKSIILPITNQSQPIEKVCICGRKNYTDVKTCWYCGRDV